MSVPVSLRSRRAEWLAASVAAPACAAIAVRLPELRPRNGWLLLTALAGAAALGALLVSTRRRESSAAGGTLRGLLLLGYFAAAPIAFGKYLTTKIEDVFVSTLGVAVWAPDLLLAGIVAFCLIFLPARREPLRVARWTAAAFAPLLLFLAWQAVATPFARAPVLGVYELLKYATALGLSVALVAILERRDLPYVAAGLLAGAAFQSVVAIGQYFAGWSFGQEIFGQTSGVLVGTFGEGATVRVTGLLGFPNALGSFLVTCLPVAVALAIAPHATWLRAAALGLVALGVPALVFTFSRGAWLAFAAASALVVLCQLRTRTARSQLSVLAAGALVTLVAGIALYVGFGDEIAARLTRSPAESLAIRHQLNLAALRLIGENPILGTGPNQFALHLLGRNESDAVAPAHDLYLLVAAEAGLVGLALFGWQLARCVGGGAFSMAREADVAASIRLGLAAGFVGFLLHQIIDITYIMPAIFRTVWLVGTLCLWLRPDLRPAFHGHAEPDARPEGS